MILRELFYFNRETTELEDDKRYDADADQTPVEIEDTRKTRLTLKQINRVRRASEAQQEEKSKDLDFVRQMYGIAANAEAGGEI